MYQPRYLITTVTSDIDFGCEFSFNIMFQLQEVLLLVIANK